jgi:molybdenum cofactor sulfurtransferase
MRAAYAAGHRCANPKQIVFGKATGVVRVSLGAMSVSADVTTFLDFMEEVYVDQYPVEPEVDAKEFLMSLDQAKEYEPSYPHSLSVRSASRASAGRASQVSIPHSIPHALHIPPSEYHPSAPPTPSSKSITGARGGEKWADSTARPTSASAHELDTDPPRSNSKPPPFVATDYTSNRRPWEQEMRKHTTTAEAEAKFREMEEAIAAANRSGQTPSNSVKARRFGRSVVNLLRQKSNHALGDNANRYEPPEK